MTIWERVKTALNGLGVPVAANVLIPATGAELPDTFVTYQLISQPEELSADNVETVTSYDVQVTVWSRAGLPGVAGLHAAMVAAGFRRSATRELDYQTETRHFGLAYNYIFVEDV